MRELVLTAEAVEPHIVMLDAPAEEVARSAMDRARADVLEQAVLANAEGWQSTGPAECAVYERPHDLAVVAEARMVLTRDDE